MRARRARLAAVCAAALLGGPQAADARAGGGEHYGGSSSSRSSSSSSSRSSSSSSRSSSSARPSSPAASRSSSSSSSYSSSSGSSDPTGAYVLVGTAGLLLLLVAIGLGGPPLERALAERRQRRRRERRFFAERAAAVAKGLEALRARDPSFDPAAFAQRGTRTFLALQEAWFRRRPADVRALLSDGMRRRLEVLLGLMEREGRRDALADVRVHDCRLVAVDGAGGPGEFDAITLRLDASMRDTEAPAGADDETARRMARLLPRERFVEMWTFVRRGGATTRAGFDLSGARCPDCGAPFAGTSGSCDHCGVVLNSGAHDWVLTEITQEPEWAPRVPATHARLREMLGRDPDAVPEVLEDRALALFWRALASLAAGSPALLRMVALPQVFEGLEEALFGRRVGIVRCPAVGAANVYSVDTCRGFDRVHVLVDWSAETAFGKQQYSHVVTLVRSAQARSDGRAGLATERCGACGAPQTDADSDRCDHCGAEPASGARDWLLAAVTPPRRWRPDVEVPLPPDAAALREAAAATPGAGEEAAKALSRDESLLRFVVALLAEDGQLTRREKNLARELGRRWRLDRLETERALEAPDPSWLQVPPLPAPERDAALAGIRAAAAAMGGKDAYARAVQRIEERMPPAGGEKVRRSA